MAKPKVLIITGYGINCDEETKFAFEMAGGKGEQVHINDLIESPNRLSSYQMIAFPGGFSYGDDTGSGNALAWKIKNNLGIERLLEGEKLIIGICNGFQVLVNLGLLPAIDGKYGERQVALNHNVSSRYIDRWVDLKFHGASPWIKDIEKISLPIAHGEGNFYAEQDVIDDLIQEGQIAVKYTKGQMCEYLDLPANPNGSMEDIAGITDSSGRIFGLMPHPERAINLTHYPNWRNIKDRATREGREISEVGDGLKIFANGVRYWE